MKTGEACNRTVIVVGRETPLAEAARLMRKHHVGSLVVAKKTCGNKPEGIVHAIGNEQARETKRRR